VDEREAKALQRLQPILISKLNAIGDYEPERGKLALALLSHLILKDHWSFPLWVVPLTAWDNLAKNATLR
jgi:hypothetical protein